MKNATIRLILVLALLVSVGIMVTQMYWVKRAYALQEAEFNIKVQESLLEVAQNIMVLKEVQVPNYNPVERINDEFYVVQINVFVENDVLKHYLELAFSTNQLQTDFQYGLYDCMNGKLQYQEQVLIDSNDRKHIPIITFPNIKRENYYFVVYFPSRNAIVHSEMSIWIVSSVVLLVVVAFLGYLLFVILKQKRFSEVQKTFVNNMTHELKTPLASIHMSAEILKESEESASVERRRRYVDIILRESTQLIAQVERVLQMAQSDKSQIALKGDTVIWQEVLTDVEQSFVSIVEAKGGAIRVQMPASPIISFGDKLHLTNAIRNIVDNAIKYCEHKPQVALNLSVLRKEIVIEITDNGIGIEKKFHKHLFQKFYRVPTGNIHNVKGFGLGLNYVQSIVRSHGGTISFESEVDKGTAFKIRIPYKTKRSK